MGLGHLWIPGLCPLRHAVTDPWTPYDQDEARWKAPQKHKLCDQCRTHAERRVGGERSGSNAAGQAYVTQPEERAGSSTRQSAAESGSTQILTTSAGPNPMKPQAKSSSAHSNQLPPKAQGSRFILVKPGSRPTVYNVQQPQLQPQRPQQHQFISPVVESSQYNPRPQTLAVRMTGTSSGAPRRPATGRPSNPQLPAQQASTPLTQSTVSTGSRRPRPSTDSPTGSTRGSPEAGSSPRPDKAEKPARKYRKH